MTREEIIEEVGARIVEHKSFTRDAVLNCMHRGSPIRREPCKTCSGSVMAKIFACEIHTECTMFSKPIVGVKCCWNCSDAENKLTTDSKPLNTAQSK